MHSEAKGRREECVFPTDLEMEMNQQSRREDAWRVDQGRLLGGGKKLSLDFKTRQSLIR
jgi:hypothetical protein